MTDLALGFDLNYTEHARVVMRSVVSASPAGDGRHSFWLAAASDVPAEVRQRFVAEFCESADVSFVDADVALSELPLSNDPFGQHISRAMYLRLFIPDQLPSHVRRVVYLDSDVLCVGPIDQLAHLDMNGHTVAAVRDAYTRRLHDSGALPGMWDLTDVDPTAAYFNSGVLLVDVDRWRDADVTRRCLDYIRRHVDDARYPDQDALNFVLFNDWQRLPREWNYMMSWRLEPHLGGSLSSARIVHATGPSKFWSPDYPADSVFRKLYTDLRAGASSSEPKGFEPALSRA